MTQIAFPRIWHHLVKSTQITFCKVRDRFVIAIYRISSTLTLTTRVNITEVWVLGLQSIMKLKKKLKSLTIRWQGKDVLVLLAVKKYYKTQPQLQLWSKKVVNLRRVPSLQEQKLDCPKVFKFLLIVSPLNKETPKCLKNETLSILRNNSTSLFWRRI